MLFMPSTGMLGGMALIYYCRIYLNYQHMTICWQFVIDKPLLPFSDAARIGRSKGTFTISYLKLIFEWYIEYQCLTIESTNVLLFRVNVVEYFLLDERLLVLNEGQDGMFRLILWMFWNRPHPIFTCCSLLVIQRLFDSLSLKNFVKL